MSYSFLSKMIEKGHRPLDVKNGDEIDDLAETISKIREDIGIDK